MSLYVTDTHALLWYLAGSPQLSVAARSALDEAVHGSGEVRVPAIVLAELVMLVEKRRITTDVNGIVAALRAIPGFCLTSLSPEIAIRIQSLTALPDIHDRLIVAEALESGASLITCDQVITRSGAVATVW